MAPVLAVILNAPAGGADAGAALPLAFLIAFIAALFIGNTVIEFAKKLSSAGSFYSFLSQSLGAVRFFSGWLYAGAYVVLMIGLVTASGVPAPAGVQLERPVVGPGHHPGRDRDDLLGPQHQDVGRTSAICSPPRSSLFSLLAIIAIAQAGHRQLTWLSSRPRDRAVSPASPGRGVRPAVVHRLRGRRPPSARKPPAPSGMCRSRSASRWSGVGVFFVVRRLRARRRVPPQRPPGSRRSWPAGSSSPRSRRRTRLAQAARRPGRHRQAVLLHARRAEHHRAGRLPRWRRAHHPREPVRRYTRASRSPFVAIYGVVGFSVVVGIILSAWLGELTAVYGWTGSIGTIAVILVYEPTSQHQRSSSAGGSPTSSVLKQHLIAPVIGAACSTHALQGKPSPASRSRTTSWPTSCWPGSSFADYGLYAYLKRRSPERLAALGATMATDEIDFAEQHSPSLSSGARDLP